MLKRRFVKLVGFWNVLKMPPRFLGGRFGDVPKLVDKKSELTSWAKHGSIFSAMITLLVD